MAVLDANGSGSAIDLPREDWAPRWRGLGWNTIEVDGHDLAALTAALHDTRQATAPTALILHTIKGRGLLAPGRGVQHPQCRSRRAPARLRHRRAHRRGPGRPRRPPPGRRPPPPEHRARAHGTPGPGLRLPPAPPGHPLGAAPMAKKTLAAELAAALTHLPMLWMAPDAIRNCGLLDRMTATGSWQWDLPRADVLQCAIAEQDAASLAAGAAAAGLRPVTGVDGKLLLADARPDPRVHRLPPSCRCC
ncbi:hypothetical protein [Amycolatopsis magusensis]|uniref:hypothetical protein n=1 Tax=Amycolatopsis magusensis TaxID=882444 RepID=UPI0037A5C08C